jgi:hypothetical protein
LCREPVPGGTWSVSSHKCGKWWWWSSSDHREVYRLSLYMGPPPIIPERVFEQRTSSMLMRRAILSIPLIL